MPSLRNLTTSTIENSVNPCYSNITNAINCDDYNECSSISINNNAPICCTSYLGCYNSTNITNSISLNNSIIKNTAIRCDGYQSCDDMQNFIFAKNGGNIYFTGRYAIVDTSYTRIIETTNLYSIFCTGYGSCYGSNIFRNALNLYCLGKESCRDDDQEGYIEYISNIFAYSYQSAYETTMINIFDSVYCNSYQACYLSSITNVVNNVYGNGYQSLYSSTITNITNVCCCIICV